MGWLENLALTEGLTDILFLFIYMLFGVNILMLVANIFLFWRNKDNTKSKTSDEKKKVHLLCVIGSGGHTAEILKLLSEVDERYSPRTYVVANTDKMGEKKVIEFEENRRLRLDSLDSEDDFNIKFISRSREVKQNYYSAISSTIGATFHSLIVLWKTKPDVILCNGPGTGLPICVLASVLSLLRLLSTRVLFVESVCRVCSLSLTGRILYWTRTADALLVQWPELQRLYPRTKYIRRLV